MNYYIFLIIFNLYYSLTSHSLSVRYNKQICPFAHLLIQCSFILETWEQKEKDNRSDEKLLCTYLCTWCNTFWIFLLLGFMFPKSLPPAQIFCPEHLPSMIIPLTHISYQQYFRLCLSKGLHNVTLDVLRHCKLLGLSLLSTVSPLMLLSQWLLPSATLRPRPDIWTAHLALLSPFAICATNNRVLERTP